MRIKVRCQGDNMVGQVKDKVVYLQAMKTYGRSRDTDPPTLTSGLDGGGQSASHHGRFTPRA
jgi:hypothetical protein